MKNKVVMIVVALVALAAGVGIGWFFLGNRGPAPIPPASYEIGGVSIPALTQDVMPELLEMDSLLADESETEAEAGDESAAGETSGVQAYRYEKLETTAVLSAQYAELLTGEEYGFQYVDASLLRTDAPKAYEASGSLYLAQEQPEHESSVLMLLSWDEKGCTVALEQVPERIHEEARRFSSMETITYLRQLEPGKLGLEGDTMDDYRIYTLSGGVLVDGSPCIPVNIYYRNPETGTNEIGGIYYLSTDQRRIYREDPDTGEVREIIPDHGSSVSVERVGD